MVTSHISISIYRGGLATSEGNERAKKNEIGDQTIVTPHPDDRHRRVEASRHRCISTYAHRCGVCEVQSIDTVSDRRPRQRSTAATTSTAMRGASASTSGPTVSPLQYPPSPSSSSSSYDSEEDRMQERLRAMSDRRRVAAQAAFESDLLRDWRAERRRAAHRNYCYVVGSGQGDEQQQRQQRERSDRPPLRNKHAPRDEHRGADVALLGSTGQVHRRRGVNHHRHGGSGRHGDGEMPYHECDQIRECDGRGRRSCWGR